MTGRGPVLSRRVLGLGAVAGVATVAGCGGGSGGPSSGGGGGQDGDGAEVLRYGEDPSQLVRLSRPVGESRGLVVVLHGGFWLQEYDLSLGTPLAQDLADRGWTAANVEYRRVEGTGGYPATLDDVSAALDVLGAAGLDTGTVVTLGHSAGGQLGVWAAGRHRLPRWAGARVRVTHAVAQAGVLDLRAAAAQGLGNGAVQALLGGGPQEVPEAYAAADPLTQAPVEVPVWCVHGADDGYVPLEQSAVYVRAATAAGGVATLVDVPGDHFDLIDVGSDAWARTVEVLDGIAPRGRAAAAGPGSGVGRPSGRG